MCNCDGCNEERDYLLDAFSPEELLLMEIDDLTEFYNDMGISFDSQN